MSSQKRLKRRLERCQGCQSHCLKVEGWRGCTKYSFDGKPASRLCEQVDVGLLSLVDDLTFSSLKAAYSDITTRVYAASIIVSDLNLVPSNAERFVDWLKEWHGFIFGHAVPSVAGRFRAADEPIIFGGDEGERHSRHGTDGPLIEQDLKEWVYAGMCRLIDAREAPEVTMALFLQRFFEVHPFIDGNGRIGRLFLAGLARTFGRVWVGADDELVDKREYIRALCSAHMWAARRSNARETRRGWDSQPPRRERGLLENYIAKHLRPASDDETMEEEPDEFKSGGAGDGPGD